MTESIEDRIKRNAAKVNQVLGDPRFTEQLNKNNALLAELDPDNALGLAGFGTLSLTLVSGTGESGTFGFTKGVQMMLADRMTSLGDVLKVIAPKTSKK